MLTGLSRMRETDEVACEEEDGAGSRNGGGGVTVSTRMRWAQSYLGMLVGTQVHRE